VSVVTLTILSNGSAIAPQVEVLAVDIRRELNRIPTARLMLIDGDLPHRTWPLSDAATFAPGAEIQIKARWEGLPGGDVVLYKGLVVRHAIEAGPRGGSLLRVELKDKALKMTRGRHSAVFLDSKDSDVAKKLIAAAGLSADKVDATTYVHKALVQYQCSDWDFMLARAQVLGLQVVVADGKVSLRAPAASGAAVIKLSYGIDEIYDVEFDLDAQDQTPGIDAVAWDLKNQAVLKVSGAAKAEPTQGIDTGKKVAGTLEFKSRSLVHAVPLESADLQAWADGQLTRSRWSMLRGRVSIVGNGKPALLDVVELDGFGKRFNGKVLVSGLAHRIDAQGWRTDLQFGLGGGTLIDAEGPGAAPAAAQLPAVPGLQIGVVVAVADDPEKEMRVKIKLVALGDENAEVWARWASPDAGKQRGMVFWPEPGDEVVVGFLGDDPRQAVVLGSLFSSKQAPADPYASLDAKNLARGFFTKSGCEIGFLDDDKPKLFLRTKDKREVMLDDDGKLISIADPDGNKITIDSNGITFKTSKDFKIDAGGGVEIKGSTIDLK
jgi:Rhs element Vgr protein